VNIFQEYTTILYAPRVFVVVTGPTVVPRSLWRVTRTTQLLFCQPLACDENYAATLLSASGVWRELRSYSFVSLWRVTKTTQLLFCQPLACDENYAATLLSAPGVWRELRSYSFISPWHVTRTTQLLFCQPLACDENYAATLWPEIYIKQKRPNL
jgi:predicted  nucleic acid-binding Zn ribbon protein